MNGWARFRRINRKTQFIEMRRTGHSGESWSPTSWRQTVHRKRRIFISSLGYQLSITTVNKSKYSTYFCRGWFVEADDERAIVIVSSFGIVFLYLVPSLFPYSPQLAYKYLSNIGIYLVCFGSITSLTKLNLRKLCYVKF